MMLLSGTEWTLRLAGRHYVAIDFGYHDLTAINVMRRNRDGSWQLVDFAAGDWTPAQVAHRVRVWRWKTRWLAVWNLVRGVR